MKFYSLFTLTILVFTGIDAVFGQENGHTGLRSANNNIQQIQNAGNSRLKSAEALLAITDSISLVSDVSKTDHHLSGTNMSQGVSNGRSWVNASNGDFSFTLKPDSVGSNEIKCGYWGGDSGKSAFDIYAENVKITTQRLKATSPGQFITVTYSVPLSLTRHKSLITIKFQSKTDSIAGPLYACSIQTSTTPSYTWPLNIHDPSSIIKCGTTYYIYGTGDGIYAASSTDMVKWRSEPTPFAKWGIPSYIFNFAPKFEGTYWAPECFYMNGQYYLYYSASEWGTKNSCIGVAINKTLNPSDPAYNWVDQGLVISSNSGSNYNAIDPSVIRDPKTGKIYLTYGSFNVAGIKVTELDSVTGKIRNTANQYSVCNHYTGGSSYIGEASFMIYHNNYYYLFVNYGGCCAGVNSSYYIITGRSASPTGPFYDKNGVNLYLVGTTSGGTIVMKHDDTKGYNDRFYGPGCLGYFTEKGTEFVSFHYYDPNFPYPGQPAGGPMLAIAKLKWDAQDWPVISFDWLDQGRYKIYNKRSFLYCDVSGASMIQSVQSTSQTQQWDLYPLGTGEYKIGNAANTSNFIETSGTDRNGNFQLNAYENAIYEKFRILKSNANEIYFYQSAGLRVMEVPSASLSSGVQLGVWWFNDNNCQKWYVTRVGDIINSDETIGSNAGFKVYPNPVIDNLSIENISETDVIQVLDVNGKTVEILKGTRNKITLSMVGYQKGIYYIKIIGNSYSKSYKIVKI